MMVAAKNRRGEYWAGYGRWIAVPDGNLMNGRVLLFSTRNAAEHDCKPGTAPLDEPVTYVQYDPDDGQWKDLDG